MTKTELRKITATKKPGMHQPPLGYPVWHEIKDAAYEMAVTEQQVLEAVRAQTDVSVIEGPSVAGMIELQCGDSEIGYLPYHD